jgi:putative acetyltransferase
MLVRLETTDDLEAIRRVNRLAFRLEGQGLLVDSLRDRGFARLSLVADDDGQIVGHVLFSDVHIHTQDHILDAVALATLSVLPGRQRQGIGTALVEEGLRYCKERGHQVVVVLGHLNYYPRFGFSRQLADRLASPYSGTSLMALELVPGILAAGSAELRLPWPFDPPNGDC